MFANSELKVPKYFIPTTKGFNSYGTIVDDTFLKIMNENNIYIVLKLLSLANTYFCSSRPLIMTSKDFQSKITFTDYKRSADRVTRLGDFISFFLTNFYTKVAKIFKNFLVKTTFKSKLPWLLFGQLLAGKFRATFCLVTSGHTERC